MPPGEDSPAGSSHVGLATIPPTVVKLPVFHAGVVLRKHGVFLVLSILEHLHAGSEQLLRPVQQLHEHRRLLSGDKLVVG